MIARYSSQRLVLGCTRLPPSATLFRYLEPRSKSMVIGGDRCQDFRAASSALVPIFGTLFQIARYGTLFEHGQDRSEPQRRGSRPRCAEGARGTPQGSAPRRVGG